MSLNGKIQSMIFSISSVACSLPENIGRTIFASLGIIASKIWLSERNRIKDMITRVYFRANRQIPQNIDTLLDKMFMHFSLNIYELVTLPSITKEKIENNFEFKNVENLEEAFSKKKGVILALPHIGNWELLGAAIAHKGYPLHSFFLSQKENEIGNTLDYFRSFSKIILHDRDRGAIRALKALKKGNMLGMIADQDGENKGVYMNFLGHWVSVPAGPANWSLRTGAAIVPLYSLRKNMTNKYVATFLPPIYPTKTKNHNKDVIDLTSKFAHWMENLILTYPDQYLWFYNRFKPRHESYIISNKKKAAKMQHGLSWYGG